MTTLITAHGEWNRKGAENAKKAPTSLEAPRQKFGLGEDAWGLKWEIYDGYLTPAERRNEAETIELEDLLITIAMNSRIDARSVASLALGLADKPWRKAVISSTY